MSLTETNCTHPDNSPTDANDAAVNPRIFLVCIPSILDLQKIGFYGVLFINKSTEKNTPDPPIGDRHGFFRVWLVRTRAFSDLKE
jgi:hypothetical protein